MLKPKTKISQCINCQKRGHSQSRCTALPKWVKCGKDQRTERYLLTKDVKATCANFEDCTQKGSYHGCLAYPQVPAHKGNGNYLQSKSYLNATKATRGKDRRQNGSTK